jgi:hypothetical protein
VQELQIGGTRQLVTIMWHDSHGMKHARATRAFSSEVGTGSLEENASNQTLERVCDSIRRERALIY